MYKYCGCENSDCNYCQALGCHMPAMDDHTTPSGPLCIECRPFMPKKYITLKETT